MDSAPTKGSENQWYYNLASGEVENGKITSFSNRMGPYPTRDAAERALKIAAERNERADEDEYQDDDWGVPPAYGN
ncbi:hypothetical protein N7326_08005 [Corynebacterium sp. ES2794-CONJ1]|nr:hypothetical protein [Corynebacterium sp. ES2794-CONJ1]